MKIPFTRQALAVALCFPLWALAQPTNAAPASAPPLQYRSAFDGYKAYQDPQPGDWRRLNDAVKENDAMGGMSGMGDMSGHPMPMSAASASSPTDRSKAPGKAASMPAMPGMADHPGHRMPGAKP